MDDIHKNLNLLLTDVKNTDLEGVNLKIFISEKVKKSLKILISYFNMFIKKMKNKKQKSSTKIKKQSNVENPILYSKLSEERLRKIIHNASFS